MLNRYRLLEVLGDGQFHSGKELGSAMGVTRSAVWKHLKVLESMGLELFSVRGRGYRLAAPLELLDEGRMVTELRPGSRARLQLEVHQEIDSTNQYLLQCAQQGAGSGMVCVAECQRQGRGRRGRQWLSPFGSNLYLSLLWRFVCSPAGLGGLSLAVGVAVARAIEDAGVSGVGLKWPNDLFWNGRKLGGVLIDMLGEAAGPSQVVIGVGINVSMACPDAAIDQPWTDLNRASEGRPPSRNRLAGLVLDQLLQAIDQFEEEGLRPFLTAWEKYDIARCRPVQLLLPDRTLRGVARGVDESGALLLEHNGIVAPYSSGEVSLRLQP